MVAIVDYGVGNLFSLKASLAAIGAAALVTGDERELEAAERVILPGVGAFGDAMARLSQSGLIPAVRRAALNKPLLGICLGMQLLFEKSFEYGAHEGLALIPGEIAPLRGALGDGELKVPHMGWNSLEILQNDAIFKHFASGEHVYYVHSYYAVGCEQNTLALSRHGSATIPGVVKKGLVYGTQFHPEKSGEAGLRLLKAFVEM